MKKIILLVVVSFFCTSIYSQKKKAVSKKSTSIVVAKSDNLSAEIVKDNFYLFVNNGAAKDTIVLKTIDVKNLPTDCKITPFKAQTVPLYLVTWNEKTTTKTDLKTEDVVEIYSEIFEVTSKTLALGNIQKTTNITEKVFLDKLKNASETQQRVRREGYEFTLLPDGDVSLKNKTQENKMTYSPTDKKYMEVKPAAKTTPAKTVVTKKKR